MSCEGEATFCVSKQFQCFLKGKVLYLFSISREETADSSIWISPWESSSLVGLQFAVSALMVFDKRVSEVA